jgi:tetratricopeptide (TPR) repeat protein
VRAAWGNPRRWLAGSALLVALTQAAVLGAQVGGAPGGTPPGATSAATDGSATAAPSGSAAPPAGSAEAAPSASAKAVAPDEASEAVRAQALERFQKGSSAFRERRYKDAIDSFLDADRLVKNPAFAYNAGLAYEKMGDTANGLAWLREYLRRAPEAPDRAKVEASIERLELALANKGVQQITVLSFPDGATVLLDGRPVGVTPWTAEIAPGGHQLQLRMRGYEDAKTLFELGAHHAMDVRLALSPEQISSAAPLAPTEPKGPAGPPTERSSKGAGKVAPWTWTTLAVGVAGFGAALGCEIARGHAENDARDAATQLDAADAYSRMEDLRTAARVVVGISAAAVVAGGVLLAVDLSASSDEEPPAPDDASVKAALRCHPGGCGLGLLGQF